MPENIIVKEGENVGSGVLDVSRCLNVSNALLAKGSEEAQVDFFIHG